MAPTLAKSIRYGFGAVEFVVGLGSACWLCMVVVVPIFSVINFVLQLGWMAPTFGAAQNVISGSSVAQASVAMSLLSIILSIFAAWILFEAEIHGVVVIAQFIGMVITLIPTVLLFKTHKDAGCGYTGPVGDICFQATAIDAINFTHFGLWTIATLGGLCVWVIEAEVLDDLAHYVDDMIHSRIQAKKDKRAAQDLEEGSKKQGEAVAGGALRPEDNQPAAVTV